MHEYLISLIVVLLAIPAAYVLARLTKEELKKRKKFFIAFLILFVATALLSLIFQFDKWQVILFTSLFMALVEIFLLVFSK